MFKMILFVKSKRIEATGPKYKKSYKLTGFNAINKALMGILESKGMTPNNNTIAEVTKVLFGDNPTSYLKDGIQYDRIKNGYLIK